MPYRRNGGLRYTADIHPRGYPHRVGPLSTGATSKAIALQVEATVRELAITGQHDALDALRAGRITLPALHAAKVAGRLHELLREVTDPPLVDAVRDLLRSHNDARYKTAMDRVLEVAPIGASASWLKEPNSVGLIVRRYRELGLSGGTERREMSAVRLLLKQCFGKAVAAEIMDQDFAFATIRPGDQGDDLPVLADRLSSDRSKAHHVAEAHRLLLGGEQGARNRDADGEENGFGMADHGDRLRCEHPSLTARPGTVRTSRPASARSCDDPYQVLQPKTSWRRRSLAAICKGNSRTLLTGAKQLFSSQAW